MEEAAAVSSFLRGRNVESDCGVPHEAAPRSFRVDNGFLRVPAAAIESINAPHVLISVTNRRQTRTPRSGSRCHLELEKDSSQTQKEFPLTLEVTQQAVLHRLKLLGMIHKQGLFASNLVPNVKNMSTQLSRPMIGHAQRAREVAPHKRTPRAHAAGARITASARPAQPPSEVDFSFTGEKLPVVVPTLARCPLGINVMSVKFLLCRGGHGLSKWNQNRKRDGEQNRMSRSGGIDIDNGTKVEIECGTKIRIKSMTGTGMRCSIEIRIVWYRDRKWNQNRNLRRPKPSSESKSEPRSERRSG
ncbi:hypothetical protein EVAR_85371_1 [Eumeta japonica]|uniref:Uncharacterized protein n=1 Tax=Eumeta variegata TaxID=151549 RepID=A0A4C1WRQ6_EUMVA|nr:hypothetical protein EVAR_85371_1 [Eumeta japonica]